MARWTSPRRDIAVRRVLASYEGLFMLLPVFSPDATEAGRLTVALDAELSLSPHE
jgi:hypothetical protein